MADDKQTILKALKKAGKPLKAGEVAQLTGLPDKEVGKQIKILQADGEIVSPRRCFYTTAGN
ncbi:MAG: MarR family transcriptional regulator [Candidatus Delongbacteria bacterium]|nr:MarR family transcriptional regulator [Candidatus Delongbacteria bacterium]